MHHHAKPFADEFSASRLAAAEARRQPADNTDLERVLRNAAISDDDAWRWLVDRFTGQVRATARSVGLAPHDVDDVVQSTWLALLTSLAGIREPGALGGWLRTTVRRNSIRVRLAAHAELPFDEEALDGPDEVDATAALEAAQQRAALTQALDGLGPRQRKLIEMLLRDPVPSYDEIAAELEMPIGSIGPTRARCLDRLRRNPALLSALE